MNQIDEYLPKFQENEYTVRLLSSIFSIVPTKAEFEFYRTFEDGIKRVKRTITEQELEKAKSQIQDEKIQSILKTFSYIHTSDKILAGYTGLKNILDLFSSSSPKRRIFESDPQQALDAGIKGFILLYAVNELYSGEFNTKIKKLKETLAGVELLIYYTLVEIALPFTENLIEGSVQVISKLFQNREGIQHLESLSLKNYTKDIKNLNLFLDILANY